MNRFLCLVKDVMAIVGCVFCILLAITKLAGPFFQKRTMQKKQAELATIKEMCSRVEYARQEIKDKGERHWEQFVRTNSCCVAGRRLANDEFFVTAMIMNPDVNVWDRGDVEDARVRAYFLVLEKDTIKVWKERVGGAYPITQIPIREWGVDERRNLFEVIDELCGGGDVANTRGGL